MKGVHRDQQQHNPAPGPRPPAPGPGPGCLLEPAVHGQGADGPPAAVQAARGLLNGVALGVGGAGVAVVEEDLTQVEYRRHARAVLLNVPLQFLGEREG